MPAAAPGFKAERKVSDQAILRETQTEHLVLPE
jgi:hypothetical protein